MLIDRRRRACCATAAGSRSSPGRPAPSAAASIRASSSRRRRRNATTRSSAASPTTSSPSSSTRGWPQEVGAEYLGRLEAIEYFTALNLVLELERPLTEHFWVNIADRRYPFVGLIEHSNFVGTENTGGRVFSHVTNYLPVDHELLGLDPEQLLDRYAEGLRMLNPAFHAPGCARRLFREPPASRSSASATAS